MLLQSNNLPLRIIGCGTVSHDILDFLKFESVDASLIKFEEAEADPNFQNYQYLVGITKVLTIRIAAINWLNNQKLHSPIFVHPQSYIQNSSLIGAGTIVYPMASLLTSTVGKHCLIAPNCHVGHLSIVGSNSLMLPGSMILGSASVANDTILHSGATVSDSIKIIPTGVRILPRAFVSKDINILGTYGGTPARLINNKGAIDSDYYTKG